MCSCALLPCAEVEALSENEITSNPVCGSDGITYRNICGLQLAACGKGRNITVIKTEPCDGDYDDSIGKLGYAYLIDCKCFTTNVHIHIKFLSTHKLHDSFLR